MFESVMAGMSIDEATEKLLQKRLLDERVDHEVELF